LGIDLTIDRDTKWGKKFLRIAVDKGRILSMVEQEKKIIIYGNNELVEEFQFQWNITATYYVDNISGGICCGESVRNVYELAYEEPQSFFVVVIAPDYGFSKIFKVLTAIGLIYGQDYTPAVYRFSYGIDSFRDPHLAFSRVYNEYGNRFPGFKIYGSINGASLSIVTLGGSTTDPIREGYASWPECLYYILKKEGINAVVFNGGFAGYTSSLELVKLIRDVIPLSPAVIVSYSGLNDFQFSVQENSSNRYKRPFVSTEQDKLFSWLSNQNQGDVLYGIQTDKSVAKFWKDNQRIMHSISDEFNIKYIGILQPNAFTEGIPSDMINKYIKYVHPSSDEFWKEVGDRIYQMKQTYDEAEYEIDRIPYILNFRHIFYGLNDYDIYLDNAHVYERGNQIIAANVFENLINMGCLNGN
jgi:hypothetical protein